MAERRMIAKTVLHSPSFLAMPVAAQMLYVHLQLFADAHEQLQNTTGSSGMSAEMKTFYERRLIDQALPALVHDQFGDSYPIPANNGKTIEFRKYDALPKATTPLTEGVTPEGQALTVTTVTTVVHQYGGWVPLTDMVQMTTIDNNVVQATSVLASQSGRTMDTIVRDILAGGTNVIYAPKIGADGAETPVASRAGLDATAQLTVDLIEQAVAQRKVQLCVHHPPVHGLRPEERPGLGGGPQVRQP